jgi:hypothetical protein
MRPQPRATPSQAYDDVRRILVVANETLGAAALHDLVLDAAAGGRETQVLVIVPALSGRGPRIAADATAVTRLQDTLTLLAEEGVAVAGRLVDADPLVAMSQSLREFRADLVVIATHPRGRSRWLDHGLVSRADRAFGLPVAHVIVDEALIGMAA